MTSLATAACLVEGVAEAFAFAFALAFAPDDDGLGAEPKKLNRLD